MYARPPFPADSGHSDASPCDDGLDDGVFGMPATSPVQQLQAWVGASRAEIIGIAVVLVAGLIVTAVVLIGAMQRESSPSPTVQSELPSVAAWDDERGRTDVSDDQVMVHVAGAVARPGLVRLPGGSRVSDAVDAVGQATVDADLDAINLARVIADGEQIYVPAIGDADKHSGQANGRVNINRASAAQLETLPGIGPSRAHAIVEHRATHGPFAQPGDLRAISGIGAATFDRLADLITVG